MRQLVMKDFCCGRGGWTKAFLARGWRVIGYDLNPQPDYPKEAEFVRMNLLDMTVADCMDADFICCSTPCEEFSVHCMKHFHPHPKPPDMGLKLFNHARAICEASGKPYIMENVRCAQKFVGHAVNHCGPFYFWGNAVPAVMPTEAYLARKKEAFRGMPGTEYEAALKAGQNVKEIRNAYQKERERRAGGRKHTPAAAAEIPPEIANTIAEVASAGASRGQDQLG